MPTDDSPLWVDAWPRRLGLEALTSRLTGRSGLGGYLFVVLAAGADVTLSVAAFVFHGADPPLLSNPFWVIMPTILLFLVWSIRRLLAWYRAIPRKIDIDSRTGTEHGTGTFDALVSGRFRLALYVTALTMYAVAMLSRGVVPELVAANGPVVAALKFAAIIPFAYIPIGAEFAALFIAIHVRLPIRVRRTDLDVDFADPTDFGGMYRFGVLIKYSYYIFAATLLLFLLWTYAGTLFSSIVGSPYTKPGIETTAQFALMWVVGTGLLAHSVFRFHVHMADAKEEKLREVTDRIRALGDDPHTVPDTQPSPEEAARVRLEYDHLRRVKQVREYPIDFVMVSQLAFSILLPIVVERLFNSLL